MIKFSKKDRSTFEYWFAHWCAFQMTALNLHIWKPKYLFHDIEKPWLMLFWRDYKRVQHWHRYHNNHHAEYADNHWPSEMDIDAMIIDNECSRFTKAEAPLTAIEFLKEKLKHENYINIKRYTAYDSALNRAYELGLEK